MSGSSLSSSATVLHWLGKPGLCAPLRLPMLPRLDGQGLTPTQASSRWLAVRDSWEHRGSLVPYPESLVPYPERLRASTQPAPGAWLSVSPTSAQGCRDS